MLILNMHRFEFQKLIDLFQILFIYLVYLLDEKNGFNYIYTYMIIDIIFVQLNVMFVVGANLICISRIKSMLLSAELSPF